LPVSLGDKVGVRPVAAFQIIVARPAVEGVIAITAIDRIITTSTIKSITPPITINDVIGICAAILIMKPRV
jgi:hypothetical protein